MAHQYGDTYIAGNATAHLGDKTIINHILIKHAVFSNENDTIHPAGVVHEGSKKRKLSLSNERTLKKQKLTPFNKRTLNNRIADHFHENKPRADHANAESASTTPNPGNNVPRSRVVQLMLMRLLTAAGLFRNDRLDIELASTGEQQALGSLSTTNTGLGAANHVSNVADQEFATLLTCLLIFLVGRHASTEDFARIFTRYQDDPLSHLATFLFGIGLARYWMSHLVRNPSSITDGIILENAFRQDVFIPLSTCSHFSVLKAYLNIHYKSTPAEPFVNAGQFNLMLGSRRGPVLRAGDWPLKDCPMSKTRVVMSVFIQTEQPVCSWCKGELQVSKLGEFWCRPCKRFYRDCSALQYLSEIATDSMLHSSEVQKLASGSEALEPGGDKEPNIRNFMEYNRRDLSNLHNIDIQIIPPHSTCSPTQSQLQSGQITSSKLRRSDQSRSSRPSQQSRPLEDPASILHEALSYLDLVKTTFERQPHSYDAFLNLMKDFKAEKLDTEGVCSRVAKLFKGHDELIDGFDAFTPQGYSTRDYITGV